MCNLTWFFHPQCSEFDQCQLCLQPGKSLWSMELDLDMQQDPSIFHGSGGSTDIHNKDGCVEYKNNIHSSSTCSQTSPVISTNIAYFVWTQINFLQNLCINIDVPFWSWSWSWSWSWVTFPLRLFVYRYMFGLRSTYVSKFIQYTPNCWGWILRVSPRTKWRPVLQVNWCAVICFCCDVIVNI